MAGALGAVGPQDSSGLSEPASLQVVQKEQQELMDREHRLKGELQEAGHVYAAEPLWQLLARDLHNYLKFFHHQVISTNRVV